MAYKRELIINNGSLTSYKKLLKVSDVCQLLDKSKYSATNTLNGVTFTNNGDGTITVSGTASELTNFYIVSGVAVSEHKYCVLGCPPNEGEVSYFSNTSWGNEYGLGKIYTYEGQTRDDANYYIFIKKGYTANNLVFKPQIYDLTEMYGAGNEPSTVDEFKAKFPNEMYDYSPRCWVKSYKTGLIAKTKNLFGYSSINVANNMANGTIVESLPNGVIVQGDVGATPGQNNYSNGWFRPGNSGYSPVIKAHLLAGDTVTISCDYLILERNYPSLTDVGIYLDDDSHGFSNVIIYGLEVGKQYRLTAAYTVDIEGYYYPIFTINSNKTKVTNIQIEKGSTATDYVPYGYL